MLYLLPSLFFITIPCFISSFLDINTDNVRSISPLLYGFTIYESAEHSYPDCQFSELSARKTTSVSYLSARSLFIKAIPLCSSISVLMNIKPYFLTNSFLYKLLYESAISITHYLFWLLTKALISAHNPADISLSLSQIIILYNVLHPPKNHSPKCANYILMYPIFYNKQNLSSIISM